MKETGGYVRKLDHIGRLTLPKEIRRMAGLRQQDPLRVCVDESGAIRLWRHSSLLMLEKQTQQMVLALSRACGLPAVVCDGTQVIAAAGEGEARWRSCTVFPAHRDRRERYRWDPACPLEPFDGCDIRALLLIPLWESEEPCGSLLLLEDPRGETKLTGSAEKLAVMAAELLNLQLDPTPE